MAKKTAPKKSPPTAEKAPRGAKTQWIREYLEKNPEAKLRQVSEAAEAAGMGKVQHVQFVSAGGKASRRASASADDDRRNGKVVEAAISFLTLAGGLDKAMAVLEQVDTVAKAIRKSKVPF